MTTPTFRAARRFLAPRWLTEGAGELVGFSLDLVKDAFVRRLELGHLARFPQNGPNGETAPTDALAALGRDRRIRRSPRETNAQYAARLRNWLNDWGGRHGESPAGNPFALCKKVSEHVAPGTGCVVKTVDGSGNWYVRAADGTRTKYPLQGNWDWDGTPNIWRFWVIIHPPASVWSPSTYDWGDLSGPSWGEGTSPPGTTWGSTAAYDDLQTLRAVVADWKTDGTRCQNIIIAFDPASFDPEAAPGAPGMPDGTWGGWSTNVGGVQVPSRLDTARYLDGVL